MVYSTRLMHLMQQGHLPTNGGRLTDANVKSDPANKDVRDVMSTEHLVQVGVVQLLIVKEGRVGVDLGPEALVYDRALRVDLFEAGEGQHTVRNRKGLGARAQKRPSLKLRLYSSRPITGTTQSNILRRVQ